MENNFNQTIITLMCIKTNAGGQVLRLFFEELQIVII